MYIDKRPNEWREVSKETLDEFLNLINWTKNDEFYVLDKERVAYFEKGKYFINKNYIA